MKSITFIVGKTSTGYDAYAEQNEKIVAVTTGADLNELKVNALEVFNMYLYDKGKAEITADQIKFEFDLASFFDFYKSVSSTGLAERIGMHKSLLSGYINGKRKPSGKQVAKVLQGIKDLGKELMEIEIINN